MSETFLYRRARFITHLPTDRLFTDSHLWLAPSPESGAKWRIGLTRFAIRLLGEIVAFHTEARPGQVVGAGDAIARVEGFKSVTDIAASVDGAFAGANPAVIADPDVVNLDIYGAWLFEVAGKPGSCAMELGAYRQVLDVTIDRFLAENRREPDAS